MRTCKKCGIEKALADFIPNQRLKDGREYECKACAQARQIRWRHENPDGARAIRNRWAANNPEQVKLINQNYYQANRDKVKTSARAWRKANPQRWAEILRINRLRRESRKRGAANFDVSVKDLRRLLNSSCSVLGCKSTDIQIDHIVPVARGGSHGIGNLQPLCGHHNASKNDRTWMEFRMYLKWKSELAA